MFCLPSRPYTVQRMLGQRNTSRNLPIETAIRNQSAYVTSSTELLRIVARARL